jgi:hypothetical protein
MANLLVMSCKSEQEGGYRMTDMPIRKTIEISRPIAGQLVVVVRFENVSNFDVFVLKNPPPLFVTSGTMDLDEIGRSEKRRPYTLADYERVSPTHTAERTREISSTFAWLPGTHTYEVSISGNYEDPSDHRRWESPRVAARFDWTHEP